jgi:hypothetical protein
MELRIGRVLIVGDRLARAGLQATDLVRLNVIFAIGDPSTQLEEPGTFTGPPPALKRARTHAPAACELALVQVFDAHNVSPRSAAKVRGERR